MTKSQKYKVMFLLNDGEVWSDNFEDIYRKAYEEAALVLFDCTLSHYKPLPQKYFECKAIFLLGDGSFIIFKTWEEITTCTELKNQGFVMDLIQLNDEMPSFINCKILSRLLKGGNNE